MMKSYLLLDSILGTTFMFFLQVTNDNNDNNAGHYDYNVTSEMITLWLSSSMFNMVMNPTMIKIQIMKMKRTW